MAITFESEQNARVIIDATKKLVNIIEKNKENKDKGKKQKIKLPEEISKEVKESKLYHLFSDDLDEILIKIKQLDDRYDSNEK